MKKLLIGLLTVSQLAFSISTIAAEECEVDEMVWSEMSPLGVNLELVEKCKDGSTRGWAVDGIWGDRDKAEVKYNAQKQDYYVSLQGKKLTIPVYEKTIIVNSYNYEGGRGSLPLLGVNLNSTFMVTKIIATNRGKSSGFSVSDSSGKTVSIDYKAKEYKKCDFVKIELDEKSEISNIVCKKIN